MTQIYANSTVRVSEDIVVSADLETQVLKLEQGTIHERAWCFQEVQLSPRVLSCGGKELYFQCCRGKFREGRPSEELKSRKDESYRRLFNVVGTGLKQAYSRWLQILEACTKLKMTFLDNKLPALSALAQKLSSLFESDGERPHADDYLAGLWRADMLRGLSWSRNIGRKRKGLPPARYRSPSWPRAKVQAAIDLGFRLTWQPDRDEQFLAEILKAWTIPTSDQVSFGSVKSGKLVLFSPVTTLSPDVCDRDAGLEDRFPRSEYVERGGTREYIPAERIVTRESSSDDSMGYARRRPTSEITWDRMFRTRKTLSRDSPRLTSDIRYSAIDWSPIQQRDSSSRLWLGK
jgi:hypothetical protein